MTDFFEASLLPDEVKLDLCVELLEEFGATRAQMRFRRGKHEIDVKCVMPWHDQRHPTASLNYEKLTYHCFSCGAGGGLLWLIGTCREGSTEDARQWLESRAGVGDGASLSDVLRVFDAIAEERPQDATPIPTFSTKVLDPWMWVHPYLTVIRGVPLATVEALSLGYAERFPVHSYDDHGAHQVRYSERVVIPHFWRGNLVGWQARRLWDDGTPKYLSSSDFPRDRTIFRPPEGRRIVVVESPMSHVRHQHHQPMGATFGSVLTDAQVRLIAGYEEVVWWPDPDEAGWRSAEGWVNETTGDWVPGVPEQLEPYTSVLVPTLDWNEDPGGLDDETVAEGVETAVPYAVWERPERLRCWRCKGYHEGHCHLPDPADALLAELLGEVETGV
jgi:CHC2-type zinc finger protein